MANCPNCNQPSGAPRLLSLVDHMRYAAGYTKRGGDVALQAKPYSILHHGPDGKYPVAWRTGAEGDPINLKNLRTNSVPAYSMMVQASDGLVYALIPAPGMPGKLQLVWQTGSMRFESISANKNLFNPDDLPVAAACDYTIAVFQECGRSDGLIELRRITIEEFGAIFGCSDDYETEEFDSILGCHVGRPHHMIFPENVEGMAIPGVFARLQDGKIKFIPAPVDSDTGVVETDLVLSTPDDPAIASANPLIFKKINLSNVGLCFGVDSPPSNAGVAVPTLNFTLPDDHDHYKVRLDCWLDTSFVTVETGFVFNVNGNQVRPWTASPPYIGSLLPGYIGKGYMTAWGLSNSDMGHVIAILPKGDHVVTMNRHPTIGNAIINVCGISAEAMPAASP